MVLVLLYFKPSQDALRVDIPNHLNVSYHADPFESPPSPYIFNFLYFTPCMQQQWYYCFLAIFYLLHLCVGVKMSCMKNLVLSEPVVDIVDPNTTLTGNCVVKVSTYTCINQSFSFSS